MTAEKTDILAQRPGLPRLARRVVFGALVLLVPALTVVTAFGLVPCAAPGEVDAANLFVGEGSFTNVYRAIDRFEIALILYRQLIEENTPKLLMLARRKQVRADHSLL